MTRQAILPGEKAPAMTDNKPVIVADIGGTHARFASLAASAHPASPVLENVRVLKCADFAGPADAVLAYLADIETTGHLCLAVPGAVHLPLVPLVNNPWRELNPRELEEVLASPVTLLNDFTAQAHAIPFFGDEDLHWFRGSRAVSGTRLIIGPGTGLGVGPLLPSGEVLESEAGQMNYAPTTATQRDIVATLSATMPRISNESLISGPGLARLHGTLQQLAGKSSRLSPEAVTAGAEQGDADCQATLAEFAAIFGAMCGDFALGLSGTGGVYLSGGLMASMAKQFDAALFLEHFDNKTGYRPFCEAIPVALVQHPYPGLLGAAAYALKTRAQA